MEKGTYSMKALIICGDGINCERETANAFNESQINTEIIHLNNIIEHPKMIHNFQAIALPGGFSFGDELNSGTVLSHKIKYGIGDEFYKFLEQKPIIGICNGFQALVQLGVFKDVCLVENKSKRFINTWTKLAIRNNEGPWLHGFNSNESFYLPIRHQEGNLQSSNPIDQEHIGLQYNDNPNGSQQKIAGLISKNKMAFGLMPHPEIAIYPENSYLQQNSGMKFFNNLYHYLS